MIGIYITGVGGMTQLNGNYYIVANATTNTFTLTDLNGVPVNTTSYGTYTIGGSARRVYTNLAVSRQRTRTDQIRTERQYDGSVSSEPSAVYSHAEHCDGWTLATITFGSTATTPTGLAYSSTYGAGDIHFSYVVTSVDSRRVKSLARLARWTQVGLPTPVAVCSRQP